MLDQVKKIAIIAGKEIMSIYKKDFKIDFKKDDSPLTTADQLSHHLIIKELTDCWANIPILSEEGASIPYHERSGWETFWLVDPLDGTKEFIKKNNEFTVNIALIHNGAPVLGVIYAPALDTLYYAKKNVGAFKQIGANKPISLPNVSVTDHKSVVTSRSHLSEETISYLNELKKKEGKLETITVGSSLKFCLIAEGAAHYYPRLAPTMEWDTAAGQIILEEAGGAVIVQNTGSKLMYNKYHLTNPSFTCFM
ncbi:MULTISPECIES: 3'(2'),5'-bisphosphate nucleotidase CysQ [Bacillaceae]|uniref:3'(2'),5'-bisphosphate nucleotidase CysQ n=1 Tax=Bacillaceae TaxID=186817 RepID=UPI001C575552|nr:3'(2'),5'-bisphosphate nucleotidase CysQ [Rossellomorea sp. YZS02]MBW3113786.1 3'(2'),5'-bisphosphate nucleotidase CysQ [Bacillus sp. MCCB 382]MDX8343971.1 3'(2'),5'-bisphosphate nucleotidase CysQ [Rossellomorea sp. YZS02]